MNPARAILLAAGMATAAAVVLGLASARRAELLELTALGVVLAYGLFMVVAGAYALARWRRHRWAAVAPGAVLLAGLGAIAAIRDADQALTDFRFGRHFAALEATVNRLPLGPGEFVRLRPGDLPAGTRCCYRALARRSPADHPSAVFLLGPRLAYLYDPFGSAWSEGVSARWREREPVAANWYRLLR